MKNLIARLQKDLAKFQATIQKEGNDLLERVRKVDLKDNLGNKKHELEKLIEGKLKKLEPAYHTFLDELRRSAKKTGINVDRIETELKKTAAAAKQHLGKKTSKKKATTKAKTKKTAVKKKATTKVRSKKATTTASSTAAPRKKAVRKKSATTKS